MIFCRHRRTTFPTTPRGGKTYVVCLRCTRKFDYDWQAMTRKGRPPPVVRMGIVAIIRWALRLEDSEERAMAARRTVEQELYDIFTDWKIADQDAALRVMTEINRQAKRQAKKKGAETAPAEPEAAREEEHETT